MGDDFYRSKDPTNSIKVLKQKLLKENPEKAKHTRYTYTYKIHNRDTYKNTASPPIYTNMG